MGPIQTGTDEFYTYLGGCSCGCFFGVIALVAAFSALITIGLVQ
jgi:hypothetical protein